jgi:hypothetical protein
MRQLFDPPHGAAARARIAIPARGFVGSFSSKQNSSAFVTRFNHPRRRTPAAPQPEIEMSKSNLTPMTPEAVSRIARSEATSHAGQIRAGSFASRADAAMQRAAAKPSHSARSGAKGGKRS